jgi:2'-5' RNA ligase
MVELEKNSTLLSVQILLPESIERRLERRTQRMPGASWPAWGGHITLVPNFTARGSIEEVRARVAAACVELEPFRLRLDGPVAVQDTTRPDYSALFLTVKGVDEEDDRRLHALRDALLSALETMREDLRPRLIEMPFLPHVTLALGLGEAEAAHLVRAIRAEPIEAEFEVEVIWLIAQIHAGTTRYERYPITLGKVSPAELLRD